MDSRNQLQIFIFCIGIGLVGGVFYEIFTLVRLVLGGREEKNAWLTHTIDFLFFVFFACFCVISSFFLHFPALRGYMWLGFALGGGLYAKTLRRIVAFLEKICYNKLRKGIKRLKKKRKSSKKGVESL